MGELRPCSFPISPTACRSVSSRPPPAPERMLRTVTCPQTASPHRLRSPPCLSRRNAPSRIPAPWASCALLTLRICHGLSLRLPHHVRRQRYPERTRTLTPHFHSEGGIQMVTTELKRIPRTCPPRRRSHQVRHRTESRRRFRQRPAQSASSAAYPSRPMRRRWMRREIPSA